VAMGKDTESASDVAIEAFEQVYEWIKRPYSYLAFENFTLEKIRNFIYKAVRSRCINIIKKENRRLEMAKDIIEKIKNSIGIGLDEELSVFESAGDPEGPDNLIKSMGPFMIDLNKVTLEDLKEEVRFFIEEKYGRSKWEQKKFAVDVFFERFQENLTIKELKEKYPGVNIASLNTESHRMIKSYFKWAKKSGKSDLFKQNVIWGTGD
jgi:DNA-directed RNA polymerase specialized sigma24 family protein